MDGADSDWLIRQRAFEYLDALREEVGETLPWARLTRGLTWEGQRVPLLGPQGIFKPKVLRAIPLSITTAPPKPGKPAPYDDELGEDGFIRYRYRGQDPQHPDNVGLRNAWRQGIPLIYFYGILKGQYVAQYPVYIVGDDPQALTFLVQADQREIALPASLAVGENAQPRREYITVAAKKRLHQRAFRERVLLAYRRACAMCRLKHTELLDAAHILPDSHPRGGPEITNGLSLCKIHHAAFDHNIIGIRPDFRIEVNATILRERDGPMLKHGLQAIHGTTLSLPRNPGDHPGSDRLEERYAEFRSAG